MDELNLMMYIIHNIDKLKLGKKLRYTLRYNMQKIIRLLGVLLILVVSASLAMGAQTDATVNVSAQVGGTSGDAPFIENMFVLADDDLVTPGTQVMPIPGVGNEKSYKTFNKYVIVSDPNGIADIVTVYEKLFYPDGKLASGESECMDITGNPTEYTAVLDDALKASLISTEQYNAYIYGLNDAKRQLKMFKVANSLSNCDPDGSYKAYFKVVDNYGLYFEGTTNFDYLPLKAIGLDFSEINYGSVQVNVEKWVSGDENWATPQRPTIKNEGNEPLQISVQGSAMTGDKLKQTLSPKALSVELLGEHVYGLDQPVTLNGFLQPCTPTQISFDIKPPLGTAADVYRGTMSIKIV
ncbi:MAG TPA: hypothetical protein HA261_14245 [Methanosarcina sp.]|nr:hypothetical protein [Methanosarcina sp.]